VHPSSTTWTAGYSRLHPSSASSQLPTQSLCLAASPSPSLHPYFLQAMAQRERAVGCPVPWTPTEPLDHIAPGVYYLESISEKHHRKYARKL